MWLFVEKIIDSVCKFTNVSIQTYDLRKIYLNKIEFLHTNNFVQKFACFSQWTVIKLDFFFEIGYFCVQSQVVIIKINELSDPYIFLRKDATTNISLIKKILIEKNEMWLP